ncbi:MAG: hypothetical protein IJ515_06140 [Clostridia bacterium]|nr:hypothetical protein [Clostridia bacterium]
MVTVREVTTKRDMRKFVKFPLELYRGCEQYVPLIYADEMKLLGGNPAYSDVADSALFIAERDGKVVGRIQAIIQHSYNEIHDEKRVRFTRFDSINDTEVSDALFAAAENYGKSRGMNVICGPLGYSDLDREGLLIEGFEYEATFEEQYNYDYYPTLVEHYGFTKEIDWLEFRLFAPDEKDDRFAKIAERVLEMHKLHLVDLTTMSKNVYIPKYADGIFHCIDECYKHLYGTVPFTESMKKDLIAQFKLLVSEKYLVLVCDENERVVSFALAFPAIGEPLRKSGGRLTLGTIFSLLKLVKKPKSVDLGLVAILPEYQNTGLNAVYVNHMMQSLSSGEITHYETNLNLETNVQVMAQWKYLNSKQHKRRRAYFKNIV